MKRITAIFLVFVIILSSFCSATPGIEKTETVYVNLNYYGEVEQINVFNNCIVNGQSEIKDYGEFESISNLTDKTEAQKNDGATIWSTNGIKNFAYTGKVSKERIIDVPWKFNVSYKLNGVTATPNELLGKSGLVEVNVDIDANTEADDYYRNNYMLEVTGSYDMNDYLSVDSDEAMFITSGKTKTLMFIVLPGQSTEMTLKLGTDDFEMDGLTFAMLPLEGELLDKIDEIVEDKQDFEDAMDAINDSTDVMLNVLNSMTTDLKQVSVGISQVQGGTDDIYALSESRNENLKELKKSLIEMQDIMQDTQDDLANIRNNVTDLTDMAEEIQPKIKDMITHLKKMENNLDDIEDIIEDLPDDIEEMQDTLSTARSLIGNTIYLLNAQNTAGDIDTDGLAGNLQSIAGSAYTILGVTPEAFAGMSDAEKFELAYGMTMIEFAGKSDEEKAEIQATPKVKAMSILSELNEVQTTLSEIEDVMGDATSSTNSLATNLGKMRTHLGEIEDMLDPDDGEVIQDTVSNINLLTKKLNDMLGIFSKYNQKFIDSKHNIPYAIDDLNSMIEKLNETDKVAVNMIANLQIALDITDNKIYVGANDATTGLINTVDKMTVITDESGNMKNAKDKAKDVVKNRWDEIDEKTTIFNINTEAKPVSFTSNKNESPVKVQFMLKTTDIKKVSDEVEDLESAKDTGTFWSRVLAIFEKMFGWIRNLFSKK